MAWCPVKKSMGQLYLYNVLDYLESK